MSEYEKIKKLYDEIDVLIKKKTTPKDENFKMWYSNIERFFRNYYGDSYEYREFSKIYYEDYFSNDNAIIQCKNGLINAKVFINPLLDEIKEAEGNEQNILIKHNNKIKTNKIFIVHGHNEKLREDVKHFLENFGIEPIILFEQPNSGKTVIEKIEEYGSSVDAAICLYTADDLGKGRKETSTHTRARQNVVLETGYFMALLERKNIIIIKEKGVETPSDLYGVVYIDKDNWEKSLLKELQALGYEIY